MAHYRIIATDLDGTLLRADHSISPRTRAAIRAAQDAGITVAFVTARPPRDIRRLIDEAGLSGVAVCSNGAILYDAGAGAVLRHSQLGAELGRVLIHDLRAAEPDIAFATEHGHKLGLEPHFPPLFAETVHDHVPRVACALELCEEEPTKLIVHHPRHGADALAERIRAVVGGRGEVTHSGWPIVEIGPLGVSKASGLAWLCAELDAPASQVIAFGDMPNDIPMLAFAGRAVGVANAHPDVLAVAHEVTASNEEDGVAQVIERILA
ncbi:MAG TPA: HAD family hydrolase [Caulobacteraceae bacterium]